MDVIGVDCFLQWIIQISGGFFSALEIDAINVYRYQFQLLGLPGNAKYSDTPPTLPSLF